MPTAKPQPTGTRTIRLADIPLSVRLRALTKVDAKDEDEAIKLLNLALDPGDRSGRIAA